MYRAEAPENCRLFILAGKGVKEEVFRERFEQYGKIEDLWIVKDKRTNEDKGVVYITFSKTSEAALAMEEMNGKVLPGHTKPIKVIVANTKRDGSVRDPREDEKMVRLFVIIPKTFTEDDLEKEFSKFGDVASVNVLRDKESGSQKGFGYVKFSRPYHAALALEQCDRSFKPKFAEPKKSLIESGDRYSRESRDSYYDRDRHDRRDRDRGAPGGYPYGDRGMGDRGLKRGFDDYGDRDGRRDRKDDFLSDDGRSRYSISTSSMSAGMPQGMPQQRGQGVIDMLQDYSHSNSQRLHVTAPLGLTQNYLTKLFNLIPGLEYCDLNEQTGVAYVRYQTPQCASYAHDKLDQFEYPIGSRLIVRYADSASSMDGAGVMGGMGPSGGMMMGGMEPDNPVHQAALVLEKAGINPDVFLSMPQLGGGGGGGGVSSGMSTSRGSGDGLERVTYCNIQLPMPKPLVPDDRVVEQRLFIVCQPASVPERILRDAFSRFGNLIDVYLLQGRNFGYAKFASKDCAMMAIDALHGQSVAGQRLKVMEAEPQKHGEDGYKRQRIEDLHK